MQKHYIIYQITNLLNDKIYVGKHITEDLNDDYMGSGKLLWAAYRKYGMENFKKEILHDFDNEDEMNKKEAEIVNESFCSRNDTYNIVTGGGGGLSNVVFYANKVLQNKLKTDSEFKQRFSKSCARGRSASSTEMKARYRAGSVKAGKKSKGKVYLFNDSLCRCVRVMKDCVEDYLRDGWSYGRKCYAKTYMRDLDGHRHSIPNEEVQSHLDLGWTLCKTHPLYENKAMVKNGITYKKHKVRLDNQISVYNLELKISTRIDPLDLDEFISHGWKRGKGFAHMVKDGLRKQVYLWNVNEYLSNGWQYMKKA